MKPYKLHIFHFHMLNIWFRCFESIRPFCRHKFYQCFLTTSFLRLRPGFNQRLLLPRFDLPFIYHSKERTIKGQTQETATGFFRNLLQQCSDDVWKVFHRKLQGIFKVIFVSVFKRYVMIDTMKTINKHILIVAYTPVINSIFQ